MNEDEIKKSEPKIDVFLVRSDGYDEINPNTGQPYHTLALHAVVDGVLLSVRETKDKLNAGYLCGCNECLSCRMVQKIRGSCKCFYDDKLVDAFKKYQSYFESLGLKFFEIHDDHKIEKTKSLESELSALLNRHSVDGDSNSSDYVLAQFICDCLFAWKKATRAQDQHNQNKQPEPESAKVNFKKFREHKPAQARSDRLSFYPRQG